MLTVSLICLVMLLFIGFSFSFFGVRLISFFLLFFFLVHVFGMLFLGRGSTTGNEQILAIYSLSFFILVFFFYILLECSLRSRRGLGFLRFDEAGNVLFLLFTMVAVLGFSIYCFKSGGALDGDYNARIQKNAGSGYLIIMMYGYLSAISIGLVGGGVKSWTKILCLFCYSYFLWGYVLLSHWWIKKSYCSFISNVCCLSCFFKENRENNCWVFSADIVYSNPIA